MSISVWLKNQGKTVVNRILLNWVVWWWSAISYTKTVPYIQYKHLNRTETDANM